MKNENKSSQLSTDQVYQFYDLWLPLLQFVNEHYCLVQSIVGHDFTEGVDSNHVVVIANYVWIHPVVFDDFIKVAKLSSTQIKILKSWQKYNYSDKFYLVKYQKDGAVLMSIGKTEKSYLVKGLVSPFEEIWPKNSLPLIVETTLLPFENEIISSGVYQTTNILFSRTMAREIGENCQKLQLVYGLISSLPHEQIATKTDEHVAWLKFYLQSPKNIQTYQEDIDDIISKNPKFYLPIFYKYRGLLEVKIYKKESKKLGFTKIHFAVYGHFVIATHPKLQMVKKTVNMLVPPEKIDSVIYGKT